MESELVAVAFYWPSYAVDSGAAAAADAVVGAAGSVVAIAADALAVDLGNAAAVAVQVEVGLVDLLVVDWAAQQIAGFGTAVADSAVAERSLVVEPVLGLQQPVDPVPLAIAVLRTFAVAEPADPV